MRRHEYRPLDQVNVTSLVDVTLVLLIVFMLTAPLMQEGLEIDLPQAKVEGIDMSDSWIVTVGANGEVFLNERKVELDELGGLIEARLVTGGEKEIFIRGDTDANYGTVVRVIGIIKEAGVEQVGLVAQSEEFGIESP